MKYYILLIFIFISILTGCEMQGNRTDEKMFEIANEEYHDYLFEFGIDSELFLPHSLEVSQDGSKSYKWIIQGTESDPIGIEVIVKKVNGTEPELIVIGGPRAIEPFVGTKHKK